MTRADTAERNLILRKKTNSTPATPHALIFYSPGSMPGILSITKITVDYLHYGIYSPILIYICKYTAYSMPVGRTVLVEYYAVSLVLVLFTVLYKSVTNYSLIIPECVYSLSIFYLVLSYYIMTRADTAERNLILPKKTNSTPATLYAYTFYSPGSMLVMLCTTNITVDDLHYGIYRTSHLLSSVLLYHDC